MRHRPRLVLAATLGILLATTVVHADAATKKKRTTTTTTKAIKRPGTNTAAAVSTAGWPPDGDIYDEAGNTGGVTACGWTDGRPFSDLGPAVFANRNYYRSVKRPTQFIEQCSFFLGTADGPWIGTFTRLALNSVTNLKAGREFCERESITVRLCTDADPALNLPAGTFWQEGNLKFVKGPWVYSFYAARQLEESESATASRNVAYARAILASAAY